MKYTRLAASFIIASSILVVLYVTTRSQTNNGHRITGIVQDNSGLPIRGASLATMSMIPNGKLRWAVTDEAGRFTFENVQAGPNFICLAHEGEKGGNILSIAGCRGEANVAVDENKRSPDVVIVAREPNPIITGKVLDKSAKKKNGIWTVNIKICLVSDPTKCSGAWDGPDDRGNFTIAVPTEPFTFTVTRGEKTFKLKQKDAEGIENEVLKFKPGEKRSVKISL